MVEQYDKRATGQKVTSHILLKKKKNACHHLGFIELKISLIRKVTGDRRFRT